MALPEGGLGESMVKVRTTLSLIAVIAWLCAAQLASAAPEPSGLPAAEKQKIEALIGAVEELDRAVFVRNGKEYPPASAAKFLRAKWRKHSSEISSAEEFIVKAATASSTTGRAYLVRFADGREAPVAAFLRSQLAARR